MEPKSSHGKRSPHWGRAFDAVEPESAVEMPAAVPLSPDAPALPEIVAVTEQPVPMTEESAREKTERFARMYTEGWALVRLQDNFFRRLFRRTREYVEVGKVYTAEQHELIVVMDKKGRKFARYDIYTAAGTPGRKGIVRRVYIPYEKVRPFLRK